MFTDARPAATEPGSRVVAMDALRGFALLGILVMNSEFFARPLQGLLLGFDTSLEGIDDGVAWLSTAFVQGKFWVLFSLLFGMGFAELSQRSRERGASFGPMYVRRLGVLLLIGIAHAFLLWAGDILVTYALGGAALLLCFRYTALGLLWKLGLLLYLLPLLFLWQFVGLFALIDILGVDTAAAFGESGAQGEALRKSYAAAEAVYRDGSWLDVTRQRIADSLELWSMTLFSLPGVVGIFLLGAWLHGAGVLRDPASHHVLLRRLRWIALPLGGALAVIAMVLLDGISAIDVSTRMAAGTTLMTVANLLLALGYVSLVMWLLNVRSCVSDWLAPAGRMALTNYLLQSLVFTTVFYGYGFGWWGEMSRLGQVGLAIGFFAAQLALSRWWMRNHRHGPVEWLWRAATYLRMPAWRA